MKNLKNGFLTDVCLLLARKTINTVYNVHPIISMKKHTVMINGTGSICAYNDNYKIIMLEDAPPATIITKNFEISPQVD